MGGKGCGHAPPRALPPMLNSVQGTQLHTHHRVEFTRFQVFIEVRKTTETEEVISSLLMLSIRRQPMPEDVFPKGPQFLNF